MIYRLVCILLLLNNLLSAQITHLVPTEILSKGQQLDSLGFNIEKLNTRLQACGQFNQQAAATLISDRGLVLVPRAAVLKYIPKNIDASKGFWAVHPDRELALTGGFISFELERKDVSSIILRGVKANEETDIQQSKIARNSVQLKMQNRAKPGQSILIKSLDKGQTYFQYQLATYTNLKLVALPAEQDQQAFALLRIPDFKDNINLLALPILSLKAPSPEVKAAIIDFPSDSKFNSNAYELALTQLRYEILQDLDAKVLQTYQDLDLERPSNIKSRYQQSQAIRSYFQETDALAQKQAFEKRLLLDPNCRQLLNQLKINNPRLEDLYRLKTYGPEAFGRLKSYQLTNVLMRSLASSPAQYEKNRSRLLSNISDWAEGYNATLDQQLFAPMAAAYFSKTKAKYLSNYIIDQIKVTNQSYQALADLLYTNSILTRPADLAQLLAQDQAAVQKALNQDLAFRFFSQLSLDMNQKLLPLFKKQNDLFVDNSKKLAQARRNFLDEDQWATESNGAQRIHFTSISVSSQEIYLTNVPGLPGTDMAPVINRKGQILGFRPENKSLSVAFMWERKVKRSPVYPIISTLGILDYLDQQAMATSILNELKKAP